MIGMLLATLCVAGSLSAQKAEALLDKAAAAYEKSNGIQATFAANVRHEKAGVAESFEGTIRMKGNKFALVTPDMRTWYNGSTQWTYMVRSKEVNLSTPTGDELESTNPLTLLRSDIARVEVQLERSTSLPARLTVTMKNGMRSVIRISRMQTGVNPPDKTFTFNRADYPGVTEIDLR